MYLSQWGAHVALLHVISNLKFFSADHSMFHSTYEVRMPVHCAKEQHSRNQGEGLNANTYVPIGMGDMNYCNH